MRLISFCFNSDVAESVRIELNCLLKNQILNDLDTAVSKSHVKM